MNKTFGLFVSCVF